MNILIAGDFCPQGRVAKLFEKRDFETVLGEVKNVLKEADYAIVNFECPVCYGGEEPIEKCGPNLNCSEQGIEAVGWSGFDCVTLANNHIFDFGEEGIRNTIQACTKHSIEVVGGEMNIQKASQVLYKQIGDKALAIINCCEHEFSIATENKAGANPLNPIQQYYAIQEAKGKADFILVIVHGGHEHFQLPSPRMVETYRFFVDAGADAVVNHHQHCLSGFETYKGKPIFYGLGNFCFDGNRSGKTIWHEGYMVMLSFEKEISFKVIPYKQCAEEPTICLLDEDAYASKIDKLNSIILNEEQLINEVNKYYCATNQTFGNIFEPMNNRFYLYCKRRGWLPSFISKKRKNLAFDLINCESHRDKLISFFNKE